VSFDPKHLLARLDELETDANRPTRYIIALSGGLDSTVLAHALAETRELHGRELLAVHVDHGLQGDAGVWDQHCRALASSFGIRYIAESVTVDPSSGRGLEAAAREARYAALASHVGRDDWLLSAHHLNDQAETMLLNLMRGSGPAGIAGIGILNPFASGWLARPLIDVPREDLETYAATAGLEWVEDPSNEDRRFDRNFLRHDVLPVLAERWRDVVGRLARSAELAGEAALLLDELADHDLRAVGDSHDRIDISGLPALSEPRQRNLLRHAARRAGLPAPSAVQLTSILEQLVPAREDAQPVVGWPGAEARRYRGKLYILPAGSEEPLPDGLELGSSPLELPHGLGTLSLSPGAALGLSDAVIAQGLSVHWRRGGEEIKPAGQQHTRKIKKLLQQEGVVPWMRERLPLLYSGGELVAVGDLWIAAAAASEPGNAVRWRGRPAIH
jgi:tRNA(Ile)-lysidine synthase